MLWPVISVSFHQPDNSCVSVFMSFGSFMKWMSQAALNDLLTYWGRREDGVQCFSFCLFKDTSLSYVRAPQGSFILKALIRLMLRNGIKSLHLTGVWFICHRRMLRWWVCFVSVWQRCRRWHHVAPIASGVKQMVLNSSMKAALEHPHAPPCCSRAASIPLKESITSSQELNVGLHTITCSSLETLHAC